MVGSGETMATAPDNDLFARAPDAVSIYEVSPRDGLQNEAAMISLEGKKRLLDGLIKAGLRRIEITSFVSPTWVPQLADAEELARTFRPPEGGAHVSEAIARGLRHLARHDDPAAFRTLRHEGRVDRARLHRVEQVDRLGRSWAGGAFAARRAERSSDFSDQKQQSEPRRSGAIHSGNHSVKVGNVAQPIRDPPADAGRTPPA